MTREEIISSNPIESVMRNYGLEASKRTPTGFMVKCPFHDDKKPSLSVDTVKGLFKCFGCSAQGSVIDFVMLKEQIAAPEAMKRLGPESEAYRPISKPAIIAPVAIPAGEKPKIVSIYSYKDELGTELYQVVRLEPKDFRQRRAVDGKWVWNMQGVNRVLYNLPAILKAKNSYIWVVEGEKDADNLKKCGFVATTNVGGATKWMDGYTDSLRGKEIVMCGDNDEAGRKHVATVIESICKTVKCIHVVWIPDPHKDVSDFIATFPDFESAARELFTLYENATVLNQGVEVPVQSMGELEREYIQHVEASKTSSFSLSQWLPSLRTEIRDFVAGELVSILAATSVGKTACLQNLAVAASPLATLLFEIELPGALTFERFASLAIQTPSAAIEMRYAAGRLDTVPWRETGKLNHISVCSKSRISTADIERIILQAELKTGQKPVLVLLDYVGLIQGKGNSRYEKLSTVAEDLRIIAKSTKTIIVLASQTARKKADDQPDVSMSDAKDSGSIENSSSVVLGAWRDPHDKALLHLKILKNTKGPTGKVVICSFHGPSMVIKERQSEFVSDADVPRNHANA